MRSIYLIIVALNLVGLLASLGLMLARRLGSAAYLSIRFFGLEAQIEPKWRLIICMGLGSIFWIITGLLLLKYKLYTRLSS